MGSTNYVDFSVRQNKSIERMLVFDALRRYSASLGRDDFVYVGLGSVWFIDFDYAHRELGIRTMISVEADEVVFKRALFNKPYRTVEVMKGMSHDVLPVVIEQREDLRSRPWIVWLDYDDVLDETKLDELAALILELPDDSALLATFSASPGRYSALPQRSARFLELFGDAFPQERFPTQKSLKDESKIMVALTDTLNDFMKSTFVQSARPGKFIPAFGLQYQDGTPMATAGGLLASPKSAKLLETTVFNTDWPAMSSIPIITPPLTQKEVLALRGLLPAPTAPSRADVMTLGFDLLDQQVESFTAHYLRYPSFVQTAR